MTVLKYCAARTMASLSAEMSDSDRLVSRSFLGISVFHLVVKNMESSRKASWLIVY